MSADVGIFYLRFRPIRYFFSNTLSLSNKDNKSVSPPRCRATWCLYFSESDVFQIYAPSLFSLDKRFFKVKPFRMTLYREGCILILGKRFFLLTVVKITTVLFWAYTKNLLKNIRLVWDSSGLHPSEWHTSKQGIFHCSNDVYFKGSSLLSFRVRLSVDEESLCHPEPAIGGVRDLMLLSV